MYTFYQSMTTYYKANVAPQYSASFHKLDSLYSIYMRAMRQMEPERKFYPDANFTLRVSYGQVQGSYPADGVQYHYQTTLEGIMEKDNPEIYDYNVPQRLRELYARKDYGPWAVNGTVPVCFIATNHTTGGNSGSPVINAEGQLIGVNFDRSWESTMGDIMFDPAQSRNITLDIRYVLFLIDKLAGATNLINEMTLVK